MAYDSGKTGAEVVSAVNKANGEAPISYGAGTDQVFYKLNGADVSTNAKNFNFGVYTFPGVNLPGSARENNVVSIGWNVAADGAREDVTQANLRIAFEEHYLQGGSGTPAFEWHLSSMDEAGVEHRPITAYLHKDGSPGSNISIGCDIISFDDYESNAMIQMNFISNTVNFDNADTALLFIGNNKKVIRQRNAANSAYLPLPYYDSDNRVRTEAPTVSVGSVPTTGTYPNCFAVFQATSMPANGTLLQGVVSGITGNAYAAKLTGECSGDWITAVWNNTNNATANAVLELRTINTAAGDPLIRHVVVGGGGWTVGLDNSDGDAFKWGANAASAPALGAADKMKLTIAGDLSLLVAGAGLKVKEGSNAKQGVATLVGGTVTVSNTSVTADSRIFLTSQSDGGTPGFLRVSARTAGTSFTITSSSGTDTSVVAYQIFEPA